MNQRPDSKGKKSLQPLSHKGPVSLDVARWEKDGGCLLLGKGVWICAKRPLRSVVVRKKGNQ